MGSAVADVLAQRGCHVALTYRASRESAEKTAEMVRARGVRALALQADLLDETAPGAVVERVAGDLGGLDILICMASRYVRKDFDKLDPKDWKAGLDTDLRSIYLLALKSASLMKARGAGRIVAFTDWLSVSRRPRYRGYLPYYVAKAGVVALTEALALELAPEVLVNAIAPGPILKPARCSAEANREVLAATPLGRWGGPGEIARTVLFLIETEFVTGECIQVDGGRHLN